MNYIDLKTRYSESSRLPSKGVANSKFSSYKKNLTPLEVVMFYCFTTFKVDLMWLCELQASKAQIG